MDYMGGEDMLHLGEVVFLVVHPTLTTTGLNTIFCPSDCYYR